MPIKNLLVVVDSYQASNSRIEFAASLAAQHGAHLVGLYVFRFPSQTPLGLPH